MINISNGIFCAVHQLLGAKLSTRKSISILKKINIVIVLSYLYKVDIAMTIIYGDLY